MLAGSRRRRLVGRWSATLGERFLAMTVSNEWHEGGRRLRGIHSMTTNVSLPAAAGGRNRRAAKGVITSILEYGLRIGLQALLAPLVLRMSGQEVFGAYAVLMQALGYLALMDLGFSLAFTRFLQNA